jgi:septal ring factor EnvC (AmiA/AmiB activator)
MEHAGHVISKIETDVERQSKTLGDSISYATKQWENLPHEFIDTNRAISELHADIEKRFAELQRETDKHVNKIQSEANRRLLVLDKMMAALETLLVRTAPPDKKPFIFVRIFKRIGRFFRRTFAKLFK